MADKKIADQEASQEQEAAIRRDKTVRLFKKFVEDFSRQVLSFFWDFYNGIKTKEETEKRLEELSKNYNVILNMIENAKK